MHRALVMTVLGSFSDRLEHIRKLQTLSGAHTSAKANNGGAT